MHEPRKVACNAVTASAKTCAPRRGQSEALAASNWKHQREHPSHTRLAAVRHFLVLTCSTSSQKQHRGPPATQKADEAVAAAPDPQLMAACVIAMPCTMDAILSANHNTTSISACSSDDTCAVTLLSMQQAEHALYSLLFCKLQAHFQWQSGRPHPMHCYSCCCEALYHSL